MVDTCIRARDPDGIQKEAKRTINHVIIVLLIVGKNGVNVKFLSRFKEDKRMVANPTGNKKNHNDIKERFHHGKNQCTSTIKVIHGCGKWRGGRNDEFSEKLGICRKLERRATRGTRI